MDGVGRGLEIETIPHSDRRERTPEQTRISAERSTVAKEGRPDAGLWRMADLVTPMALRVAATLRVADHITRGPCTAPELARAARANTDALDRLLRHLVSLDVLRCNDVGQYSLTSLGESLRDDHPSGTRARLDIENAVGRADLSLVDLLHSIRTGRASFPLHFGRGFWDDLASDPALRESFDGQMGADVAAWAPQVVASYDWGSLGHLIDVGGGNGTLIAAVLSVHPTLRGTVFERPGTAEAARQTLKSAGFDDRSDVVSGSFFDPLPSGVGGYLLCAVLHDWDDEAACTILRRCAEAAGPAGKVFIVEKTGGDGKSPRTDMDLRLLAYFGGRERGVAELTSLGLEAGLRVGAEYPAGDLSVIEFTA